MVSGMDGEDFAERVLRIVELVPPGRVTAYGVIAAAIGGSGPRRVGNVMSRYGAFVPWWRVVRADGSLPPSHAEEALARYRQEGTPMCRPGTVDMDAALWHPPVDLPDPPEPPESAGDGT